jgi:hypothetical protein
MRGNIIYILLFVFFHCLATAQGGPNDEYLRSEPSQQEFSTNHWRKIKKTMIREARGNAKSKGKEFNRSDFEDNTQNASYYEYEEESFSGEYAKNNGERENDYDYKEQGQEYKQGEGSSSFERKDHNEDKVEYYSKNRQQASKSRTSNNNNYSGEGIGPFGSIVLYTLLALFLGFIIYYLFVNTQISDTGRKIEELELERAPVEISKSELEVMLEQALANDDYRLAVRIYFIFTLKDLSEKKWIKWKKEKTNLSYLLEMRGKKQYELFDESVSIFELVWYGDYKINHQDYSSIESKFKVLLKELATN